MSWILFTYIAIVLWTLVNILDKYIVTRELKDPIIVTSFFCFFFFLLTLIVALLNGGLLIAWPLLLLCLLAGILYSSALWSYYYILAKEDVSRFVPVLATGSIYTAILAFIFLNEAFSPLVYFGIILIVAGAILVSYKKRFFKWRIRKYLIIGLFIVLLFVFRDLLVKYVANQTDFISVLFWVGVGAIIVPTIVLVFYHPKLKRKGRKAIMHLGLVGILSASAFIFFTKALTIGHITLVSGLLATKPLFVFILATIISYYHPKIIREKLSRAILTQKAIAIILIVVGSILILV
jgi:drug/metabolite transporter (DMT)-like permease